MGPTVCMLVVVMTEAPWVAGVRGAVGVVGVWGKLCGEASGADLESVTLDTRFSCGEREPLPSGRRLASCFSQGFWSLKREGTHGIHIHPAAGWGALSSPTGLLAVEHPEELPLLTF